MDPPFTNQRAGPNRVTLIQAMDMLNEEGVRIVLECVDRNRVQHNRDTGAMERDAEVFVNAARMVGFYGESWIKNEGILLYKNIKLKDIIC